jgi:hypothetical protein
MRVRLTKKFANVLNGVDLTETRVGCLMTVSDRDGEMLIAEGWAVPHFRKSRTAFPRAEVADRASARRRGGKERP